MYCFRQASTLSQSSQIINESTTLHINKRELDSQAEGEAVKPTDTWFSDEQLRFWRDNGYVVLESVFDPDEVDMMRHEADFILELIINSSICHNRHSPRLDIRQSQVGGMVVRKIQPIIDLSLGLAKISNSDRLLGPLSTLMDDEAVLMEEKLNYKQPVDVMDLFRVPVDDDRFPVHNDWAYYLYNGYPDTIISSAVTIDECSADNGSIQVFPGTHKSHIEHTRVRNGLEVAAGSVNLNTRVTLEAPAGTVMFFHSKLVHTSQPNSSGGPRRIMIYSHYPKVADMGIDVRNGPNRLRESPWEWEYQRMKADGSFRDVFHAPKAIG